MPFTATFVLDGKEIAVVQPVARECRLFLFSAPEVLRRADSSITCWSTMSPEVHCVAIAGQTWCYPRAMGQGACCSTNHSITNGCITPQCCTTFCPCQSSRLLRFITLSWTLPPSLVRTHLTLGTNELYLCLTILVILPYVLHSP